MERQVKTSRKIFSPSIRCIGGWINEAWNYLSLNTLIVAGCLLLLAGCAAHPKKATTGPGAPPPLRKDVPTATIEAAPPPLESERVVREIMDRREAARMEKRNRLSGHAITLSAHESSLRGALIALVKGTPYSLSLGPGFIDGKVTVEFSGLSLGVALDRLLDPSGLTYEVEENLIIVDKPPLKTEMFRFDYPVSSRFGGGGIAGGPGGGGGSTVSSKVDVWKDLSKAISFLVFGKETSGEGAVTQSDSSGRRLIIDPSSGTILITAPEATLGEVESYLKILEKSLKRQILIEAMLLQVSLSDQFLFGLNLDYQHPFQIGGATLSGFLTPFATPPEGGQAPTAPALTQRFSPDAGAFRIGLSNKNFALLLDALKQAGKVDIVSSPKISTLNNQQAVITVATEEVFFLSKPGTVTVGQAGIPIVTETTFTPSTFTVGVVLEVLPQVSEDDHVTLRIHPSITSIVKTVTSPKGDTQPVLDRKELTTIIRVRNGETIVIGGLMDDKITKDRRGIPLLMDIPYLGNLFTRVDDRKEKREMMIFLTPKILEGPTISKISEEEMSRIEEKKGGKRN